ncbi:hypothetical protein [Streptomyces pseudovenezuelae]|uniref:hypothetical protein n=1 Tax=Streptomyces pseudovenezuelae TaxID=67350 RepID=UPI0036E83BC5
MNAGPVPGQVVVGAAVLGAGFLAVMAALLLVGMAATAVGWWRDRQHDVGPDQLRLLQDLDKHLNRTVAKDPEVKAGLARLDAAVCEGQQHGEAS